MTTYKTHIPIIWSDNIFTKNKTIYQSLKTDIGKVADGTDFSPIVDLDINTHKVNNIITDSDEPTSAVNVEYLDEKIVEVNDNINEKVQRKITVVKSNNNVVVNDSSVPKYIEFSKVLLDNRIIKLDDVDKTTLEFLEDGLYKLDFSSDINGEYQNGFIEFIILAEDGVETTFRYLNLAESHVDSEILDFSMLSKLKIKASVDVTGEEYTGKIKLIIEKLY